MAISAKFEADFSQLQDGVKKADASLKTLETSSEKAASKLSAMEDAAKRTSTSMVNWSSVLSTATGLLGAFGVSASVGQLVQWGKAILDNAGALSDMAAKTGLSVEMLQKLDIVGAQSGVSLESFTNAAFKLGLALEGGETGVVKAIERLGLNYQKLLQMSPDKQFRTVAKALEDLSSTQERNRIGVDLMGKSFSTVAPAIAKGFTDMAESADAATSQQIDAIDRLSDRWDTFAKQQKSNLTSFLGGTVMAAEETSKLTLSQALLIFSSSNLVEVRDRLISQGNIRAAQADIELPKEEKRVTLTKAQEDAAKKLAAAMEELNSVGMGWAGTLATIDGSVVEAIKYYIDAGVSQNALATAYGLTSAQVKSVASAVADATEAQKGWDAITKQSHELSLKWFKEEEDARKKKTEAVNKEVIDGNAAIRKAQDELSDFLAKDRLDSASYQIVQIWKAADAQVAAFNGTAAQLAKFTKIVMDNAALQASAVVYEADKALTAVEARALGAAGAVALAIQQIRNQAVDVVANNLAVGGGVGMVGMQNPIALSNPIYARPSAAQAINSQAPVISGLRASGGPVSAGGSYMVGERGPELFRPSSNGSIAPNGWGGGSTTVNNTIYVNGTAEEAARKIAALVMRSVLDGTKMSA